MNCKNCNQEILETAKFCTNCGSKIVQVEEIAEVIKNDRVDEMVELPILNILDTQKRNYLNKKMLVALIAFIFIISTVSIALFRTFNNKEKNTQETTNNQKLGAAETVYNDFPVTLQEAISIAEKVITSGRVEIVSDRIRQDDNFYYEALIYSDLENKPHTKLCTLYIDKKTGEVYMPDRLNPEKPWIKIERNVSNAGKVQSSNTPSTQGKQELSKSNPPSTQGDQYVRLMGSWTNNAEIRRYVKEGYYVEAGGIGILNGDFTLIWDQTEINKILKDYRGTVGPNVFTIPKTQMATPNKYDFNRFEDIISETDLENSIIVSIEDKKNNKKYKELMIFTSDDYRQCRIFELKTGANIVLEERGMFFKTTK